MVDQITTVIVSDVITFILSAGISLVSFAVKWGALKEDVDTMRGSMVTKAELSTLSKDIAEIKGMFVLRLRE